MRYDDCEPAAFLNVDLVVDSVVPLQPFIDALGDGPVVLYHGKFGRQWRAVLEFALPGGPEGAIQEFIKLLTRLPRRARSLWDQASRRTFDIGIQGGPGRQPLELQVSAEAAGAAAALGAGIQVTVYAPARVSPQQRKRRAT